MSTAMLDLKEVLNLKDDEAKLLEKIAKLHNLPVPEFIRTILIEKLEDEMDSKLLDEAIENTTKFYSHEEVKERLRLRRVKKI